MTYLAVQVGAAGGSAHGGASPPAYSAGSGCPPGPKARASPGRLLRFLPLPPPSLRPVLSGSLHFVALRFLPLPPPSLRPVLSGSLHFAHLLSPGAFPPPSRSPLPSPSSPFLASSSLRFSPRSDTASSTDLSALVHSCSSSASFPFFPFLASGSRRSLHFVLHAASGFVSSPFRAYLFGMVPLPRLCFLLPSPSLRPVLSSLVTFSSASPSASSSFLSPSSPFLSSSSLRFSPLSSASALPPSSRPQAFRLFPVLLPDPGFRRPFLGASFCGPRVAPKRPHTTPKKRQR